MEPKPAFSLFKAAEPPARLASESVAGRRFIALRTNCI
jgi:hypothetical protein